MGDHFRLAMQRVKALSLGRSLSSLFSRDVHTSRVLAQQAAVELDFFEEDQKSMQKTARRIVDEDIKPVEYGGMGLDFKYDIALNEELGNFNCGGVPMSIAVQTDMATPALARFGSDELKKTFLEPSVLGDAVAC